MSSLHYSRICCNCCSGFTKVKGGDGRGNHRYKPGQLLTSSIWVVSNNHRRFPSTTAVVEAPITVVGFLRKFCVWPLWSGRWYAPALRLLSAVQCCRCCCCYCRYARLYSSNINSGKSLRLEYTSVNVCVCARVKRSNEVCLIRIDG